MDESAYPFLVEDDLLAHTTQDGLAALDPWSMLHLLQDEIAGRPMPGTGAAGRPVGPVRRSVTYRHLAEAIHRRGQRMISLDDPHLRFQALSMLLARLEQGTEPREGGRGGVG
jgi:hypothetical protein